MAARNSRTTQCDPISVVAPVVTDATAPGLLGMSPRQFRQAVMRQHIPHVKLGQPLVVVVADLQALAHRGGTSSEADAEPKEPHNQRLAASTSADDLNEELERLDRRDGVNAVLARLGKRLTDEAYKNFYSRHRP